MLARPAARDEVRWHIWARTGEAYTLSLVSRMAQQAGFRIIVGSTTSKNIDPYGTIRNGRGGRERYFHEELEVAEIRYKHALRRLKLAYPGQEFDSWGERSAGLMVRYARRFTRAGHPIPAVANVVHRMRDQPAALVPVPANAEE